MGSEWVLSPSASPCSTEWGAGLQSPPWSISGSWDSCLDLDDACWTESGEVMQPGKGLPASRVGEKDIRGLEDYQPGGSLTVEPDTNQAECLDQDQMMRLLYEVSHLIEPLSLLSPGGSESFQPLSGPWETMSNNEGQSCLGGKEADEDQRKWPPQRESEKRQKRQDNAPLTTDIPLSSACTLKEASPSTAEEGPAPKRPLEKDGRHKISIVELLEISDVQRTTGLKPTEDNEPQRKLCLDPSKDDEMHKRLRVKAMEQDELHKLLSLEPCSDDKVERTVGLEHPEDDDMHHTASQEPSESDEMNKALSLESSEEDAGRGSFFHRTSKLSISQSDDLASMQCVPLQLVCSVSNSPSSSLLFAGSFMKPVHDRQAPGYKDLIKRPMDLSTIKRSLSKGVIRTMAEFQRDVMLVFQNAIMYNSADHEVYLKAVEMQKDISEILQVMSSRMDSSIIGDTE